MEISAEYTPPAVGAEALPIMLRCGLQMVVPAEFNSMSWFGRGPGETYADRTGLKLGTYGPSPVWENWHAC